MATTTYVGDPIPKDEIFGSPTQATRPETRASHDPCCEPPAAPDPATLNYKDSQVNPRHYRLHGVECIDVIRAALTPEEFMGFLKGNVIKYNFRAGHKGRASTDYGKAEWYQKVLRAAALNEEWEHPDDIKDEPCGGKASE